MDKNIIPFSIKEILIDSFTKSRKINISNGTLANVQIVENNIVSIDLHNFGLGDEKGLIFAKALSLCPNIHSLTVSGNRLTDVSMIPILSAVLTSLQVTYLDISNNKLDSGSVEILKEDLRASQCKLVRLYLSRSDLDDKECASLMEAMQQNKSVQYLDLSHNRIGEMEVHYLRTTRIQ